MRENFQGDFPLLRGFWASILFGLLVAVFELYIAPKNYDRLSFAKLFFLRVGFYLIFFTIGALFFTYTTLVLKYGKTFEQFLSAETMTSIKHEVGKGILYLLLTVFLINFVRQINKLLGQQVLYNFMTGKYHKATHEDIIFMFLDLDNSTTIAEEIGEIKYHEFLKNFFSDISDPVIKCDARIFQYVGDEVVFVWKLEEGIKENNCLKLHEKIEEEIKELSEDYQKEFGYVPQFKSALHYGKAVVGEVGKIKSEIVYHGDVVNTTSRILEVAKKNGCNQLISEDLLNVLDMSSISYSEFGTYKLRGKQRDIKLFVLTTD